MDEGGDELKPLEIFKKPNLTHFLILKKPELPARNLTSLEVFVAE